MLQSNKTGSKPDTPGLERMPLAGGGHLGFKEYGVPTGTPVIFCHGWPASCTMAELTDAAARELKVRIISPDRPGICSSSMAADRTLSDWPTVLEQLADYLQLDDFRILGISGGAPYGFVSGWAFPSRVRGIAVASGAPPIAELANQEGLLPLYRWMLLWYRRYPELLRTFFRATRPFVSMKASVHVARKLLRMLQPCDADALRDAVAFDACFESQRRAWRGSSMGVMYDAQIYAKPWGFALEDVRTPVRLWHGRKDRSFSYLLAEQVAQRLPNCTVRIVDNEGHYSLPIRHMREILADSITTN